MTDNKETIALTKAVYYILLSLYEPLHGYGIMQNVANLSNGRVNLAAETLYGALSTMLEKGWIKALPGEANSRRKEYEITESGKTTVKCEIKRLKELLENGEKFEDSAPGEYTYKIELLDSLHWNRKSTSYLQFLEDTGNPFGQRCNGVITTVSECCSVYCSLAAHKENTDAEKRESSPGIVMPALCTSNPLFT